jgi:conjugative relaxase-like TrwC/TraI family protein
MITARPQKNITNAKAYYTKHLSKGEYHSEGHTVTGLWFGKGAERLGIGSGGIVDQETFERLCENLHPLTGQKLTARQRQVDRRVCHDFVVSAPKSISVMALTIGDHRLVEAHEASALIAMERLETEAATRVRQKGSNGTRLTGELVAARFTHGESRDLDPQLHTHFVVFNATWDPVENRWKALQTERMFERMTFFTEVYRSELARRVINLGYTIRNTANGFELEAVSEDVITRFSKRSRTIREKEAELSEKLGKPISNNARATVAYTSRDRKNPDLAAEEIRRRQREQLTPEELAKLQESVPRAPDRKQAAAHQAAAPAQHLLTSPAEAIDYARDHLFERRSVVSKTLLLKEALAYSRGILDLTALEDELKRRDEFIHAGEDLTTQEMLDRETRMISMVNQGMGTQEPLNPSFAADQRLNTEQAAALKRILNAPDWVVGLRGAAGTGKSTLLREVVKGIEVHHEAIVLAPTSAAVAALRDIGFARTATVQRYLVDKALQEAASHRVLVVDEAGLLSTHDMLALFELAREHNCRLLLSGDTRQHMGVEAGDALRLLETKSALACVGVHGIIRQVNREYREAITAFAAGNGVDGLLRLRRLGAVNEIEDGERYASLAPSYVESVRLGKSALVVSPTWREIGSVTQDIRSRLKLEHRLASEEVEVLTYKSLKWTRAQKRDLRNYRSGYGLLFHRGTKNVSVGETLVVRRVSADSIEATKRNGSTVVLTRKQAGCFDVAEPLEIPIARGDILLLQSTSKAAKLFNGQLGTVQSIKSDGSIALEDGRTIPADYRTFTHGYCVTSHASQGRTVDHVFVAVDSHTLQAAHLNQFYVSCSRGREQVKVYTDDIDFLMGAVRRHADRRTATELVEGLVNRPAVQQTPRLRAAA